MVEDDDAEDDDDGDDEPTPSFAVNQRVVCQEFGALYEAVVRKTFFQHGKVETNNQSNNNNNNGGGGGKWTYLVHFLGWNSRWDRWLEENEIMELTEEQKQKLAQQERKEKEKKELERKRKKEKAEAEAEISRQKRRLQQQQRGDDSAGPSDLYSSNGFPWEDSCELPYTLKTVLVDDRERIMRMGIEFPFGYDCAIEPGKWEPARQVHQLPATVTVQTVLHQYIKLKKKDAATPEEGFAAERRAKAFCESLTRLFHDALPVCLLYNPERQQYLGVNADPALRSLPKCQVYSCEFLLRLFVRLPTLLSQQRKDRKEMGQQIADLIVVLQKNRHWCFKAKYREPRYDELHDWEKSLKDGATPISMEDY